MSNKYIPVIGLEIHVELKTKSKMFCQCEADYFGKEPNSNVCPVCLGMPGALPVPNKQAVESTILIARALNCTINRHSKFDRKHYFYPDLPKGYQISQYDEPIGVNGYIEVGYPEKKKFRIHRVHLEEDTGKLLHQGEDTLVDFNRSSVPLVEIVTEPDFDNSDDVKTFLEELHTIIEYLNVSDADMEKGSMRLEPNISIKLRGTEGLPNYKVEVKNINSFNFAKRAIEYELKRHEELLEKGQTPVQETRGYNEDKGITYSQRSKENAHDYRYFPEPDIPAMEFSEDYLKKIDGMMPTLPAERLHTYTKMGIKYADAFFLSRNGNKVGDYFENVIAKLKGKEQLIANFIVNKKISTSLSPEEFIQQVEKLSASKETDHNLLNEVMKKVISANPKAVEDYKNGKENSIMFLVGQVMREMKGQADATVVKEKLKGII